MVKMTITEKKTGKEVYTGELEPSNKGFITLPKDLVLDEDTTYVFKMEYEMTGADFLE